MSTSTFAGPLSKMGRAEPKFSFPRQPEPTGRFTTRLLRLWLKPRFSADRRSHEEYTVLADGMKRFGVLDLETQFEGCASPYRSSQFTRQEPAPWSLLWCA